MLKLQTIKGFYLHFSYVVLVTMITQATAAAQQIGD